jgi:hypothetical protein
VERYAGGSFDDLLLISCSFKGKNGVHWKLWAVALSIKRITRAHTAANIKEEVVKVLDSFGIVPQCYVADNASNQVHS